MPLHTKSKINPIVGLLENEMIVFIINEEKRN